MREGGNSVTTGERIKQMRTLMGLNQRELADAVKVHKTDISAFERDTRRIPVYSLHKLASFFNTPPEYIQRSKPRGKTA